MEKAKLGPPIQSPKRETAISDICPLSVSYYSAVTLLSFLVFFIVAQCRFVTDTSILDK